jgi:predicted transcriptional regulator
MSPMKAYTFQLSDDLNAGLKALKERDGISEGEAIRRAIAEFLERKGVIGGKADRKRVSARKRP